MKSIAETIGGAQGLLKLNFDLQECFEEKLTPEYIAFIHILRVVMEYIGKFFLFTRSIMGRPPYLLMSFVKCELAKRYFHIEKTKDLILRLKNDPNLRIICGFKDVPHKSTFSRKLSFLAELEVFNKPFEELVKDAHQNLIVYHSCRDSSAIPVRETPIAKPKEKVEKEPKKRGRPPKNAEKQEKEPTVLEKQTTQTPEQSLSEINKDCAWGCKKNSDGKVSYWKGYKLHLDVSDSGFPLTAVITGANVHDSQLAIPLEQLTEQKVTVLYSLMDAGYDAKTIDEYIRSKGRVPIIDPNKRNDKDRPPLDPAKQERYKIRTTVERSYSELKDNYIPKSIYVRGTQKVSFVLMAAVLCLAAVKYLQYFVL